VSGSGPISHFATKRYATRHSPVRLSVIFVPLVLQFVLQWHTISQNIQLREFNQTPPDKKQADSVFSHIVRIFSQTGRVPAPTREKCGFRLQAEIKKYWNLLSPDKQAVIRSIFARPTLHASVLSPSGHFRIHYDTTGTNTPALLDVNGSRIQNTARVYVDSVAATFDHVWDFEINSLGYPSPPPDQGAGGGNEYDI